RRAVIVMMDPIDTPDDYDSLAAGLLTSGHALILLEPRGSGHSVAPSCPLPESWRGRESEMIQRCAGDVPIALRALAKTTRVDTSSYRVAASGISASIAIEAAAHDPRARVLLLMSAAPSPAEIGPLAHRLRSLHRPVFFQLAPQDIQKTNATEVLYHA